jgi:SAM-dependent methyltransferase
MIQSESSLWVIRFADLVPKSGTVLDVAAGGGRHTRLFLARQHRVVAVDRDLSGLADLTGRSEFEAIAADLEDGSAWPLGERKFAGVVVTNYLWRPILPNIVAAVEEGGILIYETFGRGQERYGRPTQPAFHLSPGELIAAVAGQLSVIAYEHLTERGQNTRIVQRIAAVRAADPIAVGA